MRNSNAGHIRATVEIGNEGDIVIRFDNRMNVSTAKALRITRNADGVVQHIVLDRLLHEQHEQTYGEYQLSGCIVTELTRINPSTAPVH